MVKWLNAIRYAYDLTALRIYNVFNFAMDLVFPEWMPQDSREVAQKWLEDLVKCVFSGGADYAEAEVNPLLAGVAVALGWVLVQARRLVRRVFNKGE